jgi:hypothetical protein
MRIIYGIIFFGSCGYLRKGLRIENLPSSQGGTAHFTRARAAVHR